MAKKPWRTVIALIVMYLSILMNWEWAWGCLFLFWVIPDIFTGVTYFIEPITKREHPWLFWIIVCTWLFFAGLSIATVFTAKDYYYG